MKPKFHGVSSLLLIFAAISLALIYMFCMSSGLGLVYLVEIFFLVCPRCSNELCPNCR